MRNIVSHLIFAALLATSGCKPTTQLPTRTELVTVPVGVDQLVCQARAVAAEQHLSFHYGTFTDGTGPKATLRLIGDGFELEMLKWNEQPQYELRAYDMSKDASAHRVASRAFDQFKTSLVQRLPHKCMG